MATTDGGGAARIEAVRWTGDNAAEVARVAGRSAGGRARFEADPADAEMGWVWIEHTGSWAACPVGHWVVVDERRATRPCPPDVFERTYGAAPGA